MNFILNENINERGFKPSPGANKLPYANKEIQKENWRKRSKQNHEKVYFPTTARKKERRNKTAALNWAESTQYICIFYFSSFYLVPFPLVSAQPALIKAIMNNRDEKPQNVFPYILIVIT